MPWFKVDDGLHAHRKVIRAGIPAMGLWVVAGSWCADQLSDGFIPDYVAQRLDPDFKKHAADLVAAKLWTPGEKDDETGWWFHQWSDDGRQPTSESVNAKRDEARDRMSRLRAERAEAKKRDGSQDVRANTSGTSPEVRSTPTRPDPTHTSVPTEQEKASATAAPPAEAAIGERADVERICTHLADRIESNGSRRPNVTAKWRAEARLMLDRDGRSEDDVHAAIDWCQSHEFWRGNVLSVPKLREKFDQMRLQAQRPAPGTQNGRRATTDERLDQADAALIEAKRIIHGSAA